MVAPAYQSRPRPARWETPSAIRFTTVLFPPLGLFLLWRTHRISPGGKIIALFVMPFYALINVAVIIALLMRFTGLEIEWRGGFPPVLTWHKTRPNYQAVEENRRAQASAPSPPAPRLDGPAYWTGFRGPKRDGHYDQTPIATNWLAAGLPLLWRQPIGGGYASFAIAGGMAFTIEQRRNQETVTAYNIANGREIWATSCNADFNEDMGGEGPRATPAYDDGRLYSLGAMGDLLCLDAATGRIIWRRNILNDNNAELLRWGTSSSPLVVGDKLIVQPGGPAGKSIIAYDKLSGSPLWSALNDPAAYSSPALVTLAGKKQLLLVTSSRAVGLDLQDGRLLWEIPWIVKLGNRNIAQPVVLDANHFLLSAGYGTGSQAVGIASTPSGLRAQPLWHNTFLKNKFTSSVSHQGFVYGLDEDILVCVDARTGERKWKDGRYGYGQLVFAGGFLIILGGEGELALVKASPDHWEELARFQAIHGKTWNHPALAGGKIFLRNAVEMACYDISPHSP